MADEETKQPEQEAKQEETKLRCPCCGELTLNRPPDIKSAVLDEYMASIIAGVQFQHTYTLYGTVDITVAILPKQGARRLYTALQTLDKIIKDPALDAQLIKQQMAELHGTLQLYSSIIEIKTWKDKQLQKRFEPYTAVMSACDKINTLQPFVVTDNLLAVAKDGSTVLSDLSSIYEECCTEEKLSALPDIMLRTVIDTHSSLYNILLQTGFDENFWKGIELA